MIEIVPDWPSQLVRIWDLARESSHWFRTSQGLEPLDRWEAIDDDDRAGIQALVRTDLVPWVSLWPEPALGLLRNAMSFGLMNRPEFLVHASSGLLMTHEALDFLWWPLWDAVFGGEPDVFTPSEVRLLETFDERRELEESLFGGPFVPPDPVEVWEWLRPARAAEVESRLNAESRIGLYETWEDVGSRFVGEAEWVHKRQGRAAIDVAAGWFRSGEGGLWAPPDEGEVKVGRGQRVLTDPLLLPFATRRMAGFAPRPRGYTVLSDGAKVAMPRWLPMGDLVDALADSAKALGLPDGDLLLAAATARELEVERPSRCEVYMTWAIVAEATQKSLEDDLILRFVPL